MYCTKCGFQINQDSNYCPSCGVRQIKIGTKKFIEPRESLEDQSSDDNNVIKKLNNEKIKLPRKEKEATYFGILIGTIWTIIIFLAKIEVLDTENNLNTLMIISFCLRFISILWINGIARRLRRNQFVWCIFGFLTPVLALIIIGNLTYNKSTIKLLENEKMFHDLGR